MESGIEKGIEKGVERGRLETAIELLRENMAIEFVAKVTKLSVQRIRELGEAQGLLKPEG